MKVLPWVYLGYMFVSLYFFFFYVILYHRNKNKLYETPKVTNNYSLSVLIPAWNEEDTLKGTVESVVKSDYPIKEIIIINDCSTDGTLRVAQELASRYSMVRVISNSKNLGKAGSLNRAITTTTTELVAVVDSQSYLETNSIRNLIGYFDEPRVGVATAKILVKYKRNFLEKLQALEYSVIALQEKCLDSSTASM